MALVAQAGNEGTKRQRQAVRCISLLITVAHQTDSLPPGRVLQLETQQMYVASEETDLQVQKEACVLSFLYCVADAGIGTGSF